MEVEGTQHHFTRNGRLVANKQLVYKIDKEKGTDQVRIIHIFIHDAYFHYAPFCNKIT